MLDETNFVPRSEIEAIVASINKRLAAVETSTAALTAEQSALSGLMTANTEKLDNILGFLKHANTWWGFARRHGPRVLAFGIGIAVTKGWISAENGHSFLSIFGL